MPPDEITGTLNAPLGVVFIVQWLVEPTAVEPKFLGLCCALTIEISIAIMDEKHTEIYGDQICTYPLRYLIYAEYLSC